MKNNNPNQDPKEHLIMALARSRQATYLLETLQSSPLILNPLILHIFNVQQRCLYVDLYILFDKQKDHLSIRKLVEQNKNSLNNSNYLTLLQSLNIIDKKYSKLIGITSKIGNGIIRHLDINKISQIYENPGNAAIEMNEVRDMLNEIIKILRDSSLFEDKSFLYLSEEVHYTQINKQLGLDIDTQRLNLLISNQ